MKAIITATIIALATSTTAFAGNKEVVIAKPNGNSQMTTINKKTGVIKSGDTKVANLVTQKELNKKVKKINKRIKNNKGQDGVDGTDGAKGDKGDTGAQGIQGEKGDQGIQGIQGEKGEKGDRGKRGKRGKKGKDGKDAVAPMSGLSLVAATSTFSGDGIGFGVATNNGSLEVSVAGGAQISDTGRVVIAITFDDTGRSEASAGIGWSF